MAALDFQAYIDKATASGAPKELISNFASALKEIETSGTVIEGLEDISSNTFTVQPLKAFQDGTLGIYVAKGEKANFGKRMNFVPLRVTKYRVIWDELENRVRQRVYPWSVEIPPREGTAIYTVTSIFGITEDFRHFFVVEGLRSKISAVQSLIEEMKAEALRSGNKIYNLLATAEVKTATSGKNRFKTIDLSLAGELPEELRGLSSLAAEFVADYIEYRRSKEIVIVGNEASEESAETEVVDSEAEEQLAGF